MSLLKLVSLDTVKHYLFVCFPASLIAILSTNLLPVAPHTLGIGPCNQISCTCRFFKARIPKEARSCINTKGSIAYS